MEGNNHNKDYNSIYIVGHLKSSYVSQGHFRVKQGHLKLFRLNMFSFVEDKIEHVLH